MQAQLVRVIRGRMKDVVIYTTNYCPYCRQAERFLTEQNVPFQNVDVTGNDDLRLKLVDMSGGRKTVPQIFIGGQPIGGYSDMMALHQQGALMPMLNG
jgi:glutaredoxin 3